VFIINDHEVLLGENEFLNDIPTFVITCFEKYSWALSFPGK